jgi:hypothetical protein
MSLSLGLAGLVEAAAWFRTRSIGSAIENCQRERQWAFDVNKQDDTLGVAVVPDFVRMAVVENHALAFFPALNVFPNPDS